MADTQYTTEYRRFREILISARKSACLTQQELATRLGKPQSYVAKIEGGERKLDVVEFIRLAEAIGDDPKALLSKILGTLWPNY